MKSFSVGLGYVVEFSMGPFLSIKEEWSPKHPAKNQMLSGDQIGSIYCCYESSKITFVQGIADEYGIIIVLTLEGIDEIISLRPTARA